MANKSPIWVSEGLLGSVLVTAANTSSAGGGTVGTDIFLAASGDATSGMYVSFVRFIPVATAPTTTTATVGRVFVSTVDSGATTNANTYLYQEVTLPAIAADNATAANFFYDVVFGFPLSPNQNILVTNHAAPAANTNWRAVVVGGQYT